MATAADTLSGVIPIFIYRLFHSSAQGGQGGPVLVLYVIRSALYVIRRRSNDVQADT